MKPLISLCIPAYKRVEYLRKLLGSISIQTFRDFEVIVTDDSNDESVSLLLEDYRPAFPIVYQKNPVALGTPENWNEAIRLAKGEWIKLMHDDDWFAREDALGQFAAATEKSSSFIFSAYARHDLETGKEEYVPLSALKLKRVKKDPFILFASNVIGPPSVTMVHASLKAVYDRQLSWLVDIEYYIRVLKETSFQAIPEPLIKIGMSGIQVTSFSFRNPSVEIPEAFYLLKKFGVAPLKNIWTYDGWWRLFRNLGIKNESDLNKYIKEKELPVVILQILKHQRLVPASLLKLGVISKLTMAISYFIHNNKD